MTTEKQKNAVKLCEYVLNIKFNGDINNFNQVSNFLNENLYYAKMTLNDALESYSSEYF